MLLGEVPFANEPEFFDRFVATKAQSQSKIPKARPLILSIRTFELLVAILATKRYTLTQLIREWRTKGFGVTGEWDRFLEKVACPMADLPELPFLQRAARIVGHSAHPTWGASESWNAIVPRSIGRTVVDRQP